MAEAPEKTAESSTTQQIPGYEFMSAETATIHGVAPPSYEEATRYDVTDVSRESVANVPSISKYDAEEALLQAVKEHCCWGSGAANQIVVADLHKSTTFQYQLWSTLEGRTTQYIEVPYSNQSCGPVDGPENGVPPGPWEVPAEPPGEFQTGKIHITVPHTSTLHVCSGCRGTRLQNCCNCAGSGVRTESFTATDSSGHITSRLYFHTVSCMPCGGTGQTTCATCSGYGEVKRFVQLTVHWEVLSDDAIDQQIRVAPVPEKLLRLSSGKVLLEDKRRQVLPFQSFPIDSINVHSQSLIKKHRMPDKLTILQKQVVRAVPVTRCDYLWQGEIRNFIVFGTERQVYAPSYPHRCCGCCDWCTCCTFYQNCHSCSDCQLL